VIPSYSLIFLAVSVLQELGGIAPIEKQIFRREELLFFNNFITMLKL